MKPRNHVHYAMMRSKRCSVHQKSNKQKRVNEKAGLKKQSCF